MCNAWYKEGCYQIINKLIINQLHISRYFKIMGFCLLNQRVRTVTCSYEALLMWMKLFLEQRIRGTE